MGAGSNVVTASLATSHSPVACPAPGCAPPIATLQRPTPTLRAIGAKSHVELEVARRTIRGARRSKSPEKPRTNARRPEIHEQVLRQDHAKYGAGEKRKHANIRYARAPVILLCNRPELLSEGRQFFGAIILNQTQWRHHRLRRTKSEGSHGVRFAMDDRVDCRSAAYGSGFFSMSVSLIQPALILSPRMNFS